jgi:tetratricopeptide (TPR) repeat protein
MLLHRDRLPEAIASFGRGAAINPGSLMAREGTVEALVRQGRFAEALTALGNPSAKEAPHEGIMRMRVYLESGDFAAVPAAAARHRQWHGEEPEALVLEGEALLRLDRPGEAGAALERAARLFEKRIEKEREARDSAAAARRAKLRRAGAAAKGQKAPDGARKDAWVDVHDGRRRIQALQEEGAFLDSFAEEPSGESALLDGLFAARLLSGKASRAVGDAERAVDAFEAACAARPQRGEAWVELGEMAMAAGDLAAARAHFERAVGADPRDGAGWAGLVRAARASGDEKRAAALERARADALR